MKRSSSSRNPVSSPSKSSKFAKAAKPRRRPPLDAAARSVQIQGLEERTMFSGMTFTVTSSGDSGAGSLREAITAANNDPGKDTILFDFGGDPTTISIECALPVLTGPTDVIGDRAPNGIGYAPLVRIDGADVPTDDDGVIDYGGLTVAGGGSVVEGLAFTGFQIGVVLTGGGGDVVKGCYFGIDPLSGDPAGNSHDAIDVRGGDATIGGAGPNDGNVIANSGNFGIHVEPAGVNASIQGNMIGSDPGGVEYGSNGEGGICVEGAMGVRIGTVARNVVVANLNNGIHLADATDTVIANNWVGLDDAGVLGNLGDGIFVEQTSAGDSGITIRDNVVSGSAGNGIHLWGAHGVTMTGNFVGSDASGNVSSNDLRDYGNSGDAVRLEAGADGNRVGGATAGERNVIVGSDNGVGIIGSSHNLVLGNSIGVGADGVKSLPNNDGVFVGAWTDDDGNDHYAVHNQIGGVGVGEGNEIAFNDVAVAVDSGTGTAIRGNSIHDNDSLGIDLLEDNAHPRFGPTANDSAGHVGPNLYQNFPVVTSVSPLTGGGVMIGGTLHADPLKTYTVDVYVSSNSHDAETGEIYGEGKTLVSTKSVTTDATGVAAFTLDAPAGAITATYTATATDGAGNTSEFSATFTAPVPTVVATTTTLTTSVNPALVGQLVTLRATVATGDPSNVPDGTVTFMDGGTTLGTATLVNGVAKLDKTFTVVATHTLQAVYSGDDTHLVSQGDRDLMVNKAGTQTTLVSSAPIAQFGQPVSFTATVAVSAPGAGTPTGVVSFSFKVVGGTTQTQDAPVTFDAASNTYRAILTVSNLALGSQSVNAKYVGDASLQTSTANALQNVVPANSTTLLASAPNPSVYGQAVTLTATVSAAFGPAPQGSVTFFDGTTALGTAIVSDGVATLATSSLNAATHSITAVYGGTTGVRGSTSAALSQVVTPAPLTATVNNATKIYGAANPAFSLAFAGFRNGDMAASLGGTATFSTTATAASHVGSYVVSSSGVTSANYAIIYNPGTLAVTPAALTITAADKTKVYGAANPTLTATCAGLVNGDDASVVAGLMLTTPATPASGVGSYAIVPSGAAADNYAITYVNGNLTVTPAVVTVTVNNASKTYGQANPAFTANVSGLVNGDSLGSIAFTTAADATSHVGSYAVNASATASSNYTVNYLPGTLAVTPAALTIRATDASRAYGAPNPPFTATYDGLTNGDTAASLGGALSLTTAATTASHTGTYAITPAGVSSGDYAITFIPGTLTVAKAALTVAVNDASGVYGQSNPAFTATYTGLASGDTPAALGGSLSFATAATTASGAGSYSVTASGLTSGDYAITYAPGTLTVTRAALTITADNKSKVYGAVNPSLTATYAGFVNGDGSSVVAGLQLTTAATTSSGVGSYPIVASGAAAANYDITYVSGALTVTTATAVVTVANATKVYGQSNPAFAASVTGLVSGDSLGAITFTTPANASSHVTAYAINASAAGNPNYTISYVPGTLTVTPAALTIRADDKTRTYGGANPALTATFTGFVNGDTPASLASPLVLSTAATPASNAGAYAITASGAASTDYTITFAAGTLTVTKAALAVTVNNPSRPYGQANPAFAVGYAGFVNGDTPASLGGVPAFATTATPASALGSYAVTASGLTSGNYAITYNPGTLTVTQATTTTTVSSSANPVNLGTPVTFTAIVSGGPSAVIYPGGTVTFYDGATLLGTGTLTSGGVAVYSTSALTGGDHTINAVYGGDAGYAGSAATLAQTVATLTISGTAYTDVTGNGLSADDTPTAGIVVKLYADTDNSGTLTSGDQVVAQMATASNGTYSFTQKPALYFVQEVVPGGFVQTGPAMPLYYSVSGPVGGTSTGNDFDNFLADCDLSDVSGISYLINGTTVVDQLRGNIHQGDTVEAIFTVAAGEPPHRYSLVSYAAPGSTFDPDYARQQTIFQVDSQVFGPGVHTLTVTVPDSFFQIDFVCGTVIDHFGPAGSNVFYTPQGRLIDADNGGTQAPMAGPGSISGFVFLDANKNGLIDITDGAIAGVKVTLSGTDDRGAAVSMVEYTDADGRYFFGGLRAGTYTVCEIQPTGVSDGADSLGTIAGAPAANFGVKANDKFSSIRIGANQDGINYNFGENGTAVHGGETATIGFWQNSNGQALLRSLNAGPNDTNLGIWLAGNFPNLYGPTAGVNNLLGKTNAQIASYYTTLFKTTGQKVEAQVLAVAFATYVTDASLAGTVARAYGFEVTDTGVGSATFNIGANGAAFGVANNSTMAVSEILAIADAKSWKGVLWDVDHNGTLSTSEQSWRNMANTVFNGINTTGDI